MIVRVARFEAGRDDLPAELRSERAHTHNALDDAFMTAQLFLVIATKLGRYPGYGRLGDLLRENGRHPYDV